MAKGPFFVTAVGWALLSPQAFNKVGCTQIGVVTLAKEGRLFPSHVQTPFPILPLGGLCGEAATLTQGLSSWCDQ